MRQPNTKQNKLQLTWIELIRGYIKQIFPFSSRPPIFCELYQTQNNTPIKCGCFQRSIQQLSFPIDQFYQPTAPNQIQIDTCPPFQTEIMIMETEIIHSNWISPVWRINTTLHRDQAENSHCSVGFRDSICRSIYGSADALMVVVVMSYNFLIHCCYSENMDVPVVQSVGGHVWEWDTKIQRKYCPLLNWNAK